MPGPAGWLLPPGAWTLTEREPDGPKTLERTETFDLLKASAEPMSPKQIGDALGKHPNTVSMLLGRMVRDGDIKMVRYGKYTPVVSVESSDSSSLREDKKKKQTLFDSSEVSTESTLTTLTTGVPKSDPEPAIESSLPVAPPTLAAKRLASTVAGATDDFPRFAQMVAREMHSTLDESSIQRVPDAPEQSSLYSFMAMAMPDAADPYTLQPSGLRCASQSSAGKGRHAGAGCAASRAKTDGETMKG